MTIFEKKGRQMTKINITFFPGNWVLNNVFMFIPPKTPYWLNES